MKNEVLTALDAESSIPCIDYTLYYNYFYPDSPSVTIAVEKGNSANTVSATLTTLHGDFHYRSLPIKSSPISKIELPKKQNKVDLGAFMERQNQFMHNKNKPHKLPQQDIKITTTAVFDRLHKEAEALDEKISRLQSEHIPQHTFAPTLSTFKNETVALKPKEPVKPDESKDLVFKPDIGKTQKIVPAPDFYNKDNTPLNVRIQRVEAMKHANIKLKQALEDEKFNSQHPFKPQVKNTTPRFRYTSIPGEAQYINRLRAANEIK